MNAPKTVILILATCLIATGCSSLHRNTVADTVPVEEDIRLDADIAGLAEALEKAKPMVDLNLEE
jgi:hypothetical protein